MPTSGLLRILGAMGSSLCQWSHDIILGCVFDDHTLESDTGRNAAQGGVAFYQPLLHSVASFFDDKREPQDDSSAQYVVCFTNDQLRRIRCPIWTVSSYEPPLMAIPEAAEREEHDVWDTWPQEIATKKPPLLTRGRKNGQSKEPNTSEGAVSATASAIHIIEDDDWSEAAMNKASRNGGRRCTMGPESRPLNLSFLLAGQGETLEDDEFSIPQ